MNHSNDRNNELSARAKQREAREGAAMLRHSGGRSFDELQQLVGRTAEVRFSDYGCSGERISWSERVTIEEFTGPAPVEVDDGDGQIVGTILRPSFFCRMPHHVADVTLDQLSIIEPPDRVCQQCIYCRHDDGGHHYGCPSTSSNLEAALECYYDGRQKYYEWRNTPSLFRTDDQLDWVATNPTYYLGFTEAEWEWRQNNPE